MGTRADFYTKATGKSLKPTDWIGSIAWDGYPDGIPNSIKKATTKQGFIRAVKAFGRRRDDFTTPAEGWPWPWKDSGTTDYYYVFDGKKVVWNKHKPCDMTEIMNVQYGDKSGLLVFGLKESSL